MCEAGIESTRDAGFGRVEHLSRKSLVVTAGWTGVSANAFVAEDGIGQRWFVRGQVLVRECLGDSIPIFAKSDSQNHQSECNCNNLQVECTTYLAAFDEKIGQQESCGIPK